MCPKPSTSGRMTAPIFYRSPLTIPITKKKYKDYVVFYSADEKKSVIGIAVLSNSSKILGKYWVPTIPSESEKDDDDSNEKKAKYMMFYLQWDFV